MGLRSWGRLVDYDVQTHTLSNREKASAEFRSNPQLPFGAGRSYGDVAISNQVWNTKTLDRFISFDELTGLLTVEAGVLLGTIQSLFATRGWLLPVTPGTQFVTVGGAIANDVHGKNHHSAGTFGEHITELQLVTSVGEFTCSKNSNPELFRATIGGLGLTGLILSATIQLKKVPGGWIDSEQLKFKNVDEFFAISEASQSYEYTVAWFDCLSKNGRGVFTRGNHSNSQKPVAKAKPKVFPFTPPVSLINRLTLPFLNWGYYTINRSGSKEISYDKFFYPLDGISHWNRAYGPKGFFQHQSVLPRETARAALEELRKAIRESNQGSLLAVLKTTAARDAPGLLTFPIEGVTIALDFPNLGNKTFYLLAQLEEIVLRHGGRLNPSKDATMSQESFEKGFPKLPKFLKHKDPALTSKFFERVHERKS